jgi:hypothetical protein
VIDLAVGDKFITTYRWGEDPMKHLRLVDVPYVVTEVSGPCRCRSLEALLAGDEEPSPEHYHFTAARLDTGEDGFEFAGFRQQGKEIVNVWHPWRGIRVVEKAKVRQSGLF